MAASAMVDSVGVVRVLVYFDKELILGVVVGKINLIFSDNFVG